MAVSDLAAQAAAEEQESEGVAGDGDDEHAAVEGHDGEHEQVGKAHADGVESGLERAGGESRPLVLDQTAVREPLDEHGHHENENQGERVHAAASPGPSREQNLRILTPEEGHVGERLLCTHPSHVSSPVRVPSHVHLPPRPEAIWESNRNSCLMEFGAVNGQYNVYELLQMVGPPCLYPQITTTASTVPLRRDFLSIIILLRQARQ